MSRKEHSKNFHLFKGLRRRLKKLWLREHRQLISSRLFQFSRNLVRVLYMEGLLRDCKRLQSAAYLEPYPNDCSQLGCLGHVTEP